MITGLTFNEKEQKAIEAFQEKHLKCHFESAIGGKISITAVLTGVGINYTIKCGSCDKEEEISDYDSW